MTRPKPDLARLSPAGPPRRPGHDPATIGTRPAAREMIRSLEKARTFSSCRPQAIFAIWLRWVELALITLPAHLEATAQTGEPHTPQVQTLYAYLRECFPASGYVSQGERVWDCFAEGFSSLINSARPGLWVYNQFEVGYTGPDFLGETYMAYSPYDPDWPTYPTFIAWNDHLATVRWMFAHHSGESQVLEHLKDACRQPDNAAGRAALAHPPSEDQPDQVAAWLFNQVIPAARPHYEPISLADIWAGSGAKLLALATQFPDWAVLRGLVTFMAAEPDEVCLRMCRINTMLYGLNGYYLQLLDTTGAGRFFAGDEAIRLEHPQDVLQVALKVYGRHDQIAAVPLSAARSSSFEQLFKRKA